MHRAHASDPWREWQISLPTQIVKVFGPLLLIESTVAQGTRVFERRSESVGTKSMRTGSIVVKGSFIMDFNDKSRLGLMQKFRIGSFQPVGQPDAGACTGQRERGYRPRDSLGMGQATKFPNTNQATRTRAVGYGWPLKAAECQVRRTA